MKFSAIIMVFAAMALTLGAVTVDPANAVIVVAKDADGTLQFAAKELQKYVKCITGKTMAITGKAPAGKYLRLQKDLLCRPACHCH